MQPYLPSSPVRAIKLVGVMLLLALSSGCSDRTERREGETDLAWGERLFAHLGCVTCHSLSGAQLQGPPMGQQWLGPIPVRTGEVAVLDEDYVRQSIVDPTAQVRDGYFPVMLPYLDLSAEQLDALVVYWRHESAPAPTDQ